MDQEPQRLALSSRGCCVARRPADGVDHVGVDSSQYRSLQACQVTSMSVGPDVASAFLVPVSCRGHDLLSSFVVLKLCGIDVNYGPSITGLTKAYLLYNSFERGNLASWWGCKPMIFFELVSFLQSQARSRLCRPMMEGQAVLAPWPPHSTPVGFPEY